MVEQLSGSDALPDPLREDGAAAEEPSRRPHRPWGRWVTVVSAIVLCGLVGIGAIRARDAAIVDRSAMAGSPAVRSDSYRLSTAADAKVTLVEFVDFECEDCGNLNHQVRRIRADYEGRVTFVVRYFPSETHANAARAARAAEAAARQGRFAAMYDKLIDSQARWSSRQEPQDDLFRGFAADVGLDLRAWDAAYTADTTWARIQADIDDGLALGITSTPAFFIDGKQIKPTSPADLTAALDEALAR